MEISYDNQPSNEYPQKQSHLRTFYDKISSICYPIGFKYVQNKANSNPFISKDCSVCRSLLLFSVFRVFRGSKNETNPTQRSSSVSLENNPDPDDSRDSSKNQTNPKTGWHLKATACGCFLRNEPKLLCSTVALGCDPFYKTNPNIRILLRKTRFAKKQTQIDRHWPVIPNPFTGQRPVKIVNFLNFDICSLIFDMNYKTNPNSCVAQSPSAVVIHLGPKERPYSGFWLQPAPKGTQAQKTKQTQIAAVSSRVWVNFHRLWRLLNFAFLSLIFDMNYKTNPNPMKRSLSTKWLQF
jgi:hypothetical protein